MLLRLLLVIGLAVISVLAYQIVTRRHLRSVSQNAPRDLLLQGLRPHTPTIVYFTTPYCIPCETQQKPALARLQAELGERVQVVQVDASQQPDAADRWGVMSAPTTFVLDADGAALAVNHGAADAETLKQQLGITADDPSSEYAA